jgi:hypothetical protein
VSIKRKADDVEEEDNPAATVGAVLQQRDDR